MKKKRVKNEDHGYEVDHRVYVFHNTLLNFNLFLNAEHADEAMDKFDACCFGNRKHWKIFIELSQQPAEGPDDK